MNNYFTCTRYDKQVAEMRRRKIQVKIFGSRHYGGRQKRLAYNIIMYIQYNFDNNTFYNFVIIYVENKKKQRR